VYLTYPEAVYIMRAGEFVKVGITKGLTKRRYALQNGCPLDIEFVGATIVGEGGFPARDVERASKRS